MLEANFLNNFLFFYFNCLDETDFKNIYETSANNNDKAF